MESQSQFVSGGDTERFQQVLRATCMTFKQRHKVTESNKTAAIDFLPSSFLLRVVIDAVSRPRRLVTARKNHVFKKGEGGVKGGVWLFQPVFVKERKNERHEPD